MRQLVLPGAHTALILGNTRSLLVPNHWWEEGGGGVVGESGMLVPLSTIEAFNMRGFHPMLLSPSNTSLACGHHDLLLKPCVLLLSQRTRHCGQLLVHPLGLFLLGVQGPSDTGNIPFLLCHQKLQPLDFTLELPLALPGLGDPGLTVPPVRLLLLQGSKGCLQLTSKAGQLRILLLYCLLGLLGLVLRLW